jgi:hypothetical protein
MGEAATSRRYIVVGG